MSRIFRYSIIRYRPFAETGEFANIGVISANLEAGNAAYKLAPKRFGRVRHFFDESAYSGYRSAVGYLHRELERIAREMPLLGSEQDRAVFFEIVKRRESSIVFSESRIINLDEPLNEVVRILYDRYIGRNFEPTENVESVLTKRLRTALRTHGVRHLRTVRIDDDVVPVILPLGMREGDVYAVKPLAFSQKTPLSVFDHGANWRNRFEYLLDKGKIKPNNIMIAMQEPDFEDSSFAEAYSLAARELRQLPFEVVASKDRRSLDARVIDFARRLPFASPYSGMNTWRLN